MDIKNKTVELFNSVLKNEEMSKKLVEGIKYNTENDMQLYCIIANKIYNNLKSDYVINNIKNDLWDPVGIAELPRETTNPDFWQKLQEERLPKGSKEKVKGTNKCPRCKSWYTTYKQAQTRSGDEGLTTRCACLDCEHHWKFS